MTFAPSDTRHDALTKVRRGLIVWWPPHRAGRNGHGWVHVTPGVPLDSATVQALNEAHAAGLVSAEGVGRKARRTAYLTDAGLSLLREWDRGAA